MCGPKEENIMGLLYLIFLPIILPIQLITIGLKLIGVILEFIGSIFVAFDISNFLNKRK